MEIRLTLSLLRKEMDQFRIPATEILKALTQTMKRRGPDYVPYLWGETSSRSGPPCASHPSTVLASLPCCALPALPVSLLSPLWGAGQLLRPKQGEVRCYRPFVSFGGKNETNGQTVRTPACCDRRWTLDEHCALVGFSVSSSVTVAASRRKTCSVREN